MRGLLISLAALISLAGAPAKAATSIYVDSSSPLYPGFADAVNASDALGAADGSSAFVPLGGFIAFLTTPFFSVVDLDFEFTGVTGAGTVRLYVGRTNGAGGFTALNSRFFTVTNGFNNFSSGALSTYCAGLGGCDTFITQAWVGTTFGLDSALGPNPEPSAWALMILGFIGVAGRMKARRKSDRTAALTPTLA